jgi:hypothetical protein
MLRSRDRGAARDHGQGAHRAGGHALVTSGAGSLVYEQALAAHVDGGGGAERQTEAARVAHLMVNHGYHEGSGERHGRRECEDR